MTPSLFNCLLNLLIQELTVPWICSSLFCLFLHHQLYQAIHHLDHFGSIWES